MSSPARLTAEVEILRVPQVKALFDELKAKAQELGATIVQVGGTFNTAFSRVESSTQGIKRAGDVMTAFGQNTGVATQGIGTFSNGVLQLNQSVAPTEGTLRRLGSAILQNATSFGIFSASVFGIIASLSNLQRQSLSVETQMLRQQRANTTLRTAELALNEARDKGTASSERIAVLESRVADARQRVEIETARTELTQGNYNEALGAFVTQIVPQLVTAGASGVQMFQGMAKAIKDNNISFSSVGGSIKNALAAVLNFGTTSKDVINTMKSSGDALAAFDGSARKAGVTLGQLKNVITGIPWGLIGLGAAGAAVALYAIGTNAFGIRTHMNNIGVEIGKQIPILQQFLDYIGKWGDKLELSFAVISGHFGEMSQGEIKSFNTAITQALEDPIDLFDQLGDKVSAATGIIGDSIQKISDPADQLIADLAQINLLWDQFQSGKITGAEQMLGSIRSLDLWVANLAERAKTEFPQFRESLSSLSEGIKGKLADNLITEDEFSEIFKWLQVLGPLIQHLREEAVNTKSGVVDLGTTFQAANAGADAFMASVPANLFETEKGLVLVQERLRQVIEGLKAAAETKEGSWITPEFIAIFEKLANVDISATVKQLKDAKNGTVQLTDSEKQMNDTLAEQDQLYKDRRAEMAKHVQEAEELTKSQNAINAAFGTNITLIGMTEKQIDRLTNISNSYIDQIQSEEDSLAKLAIQYGIQSPAILEMIQNTDDNRVAIRNIIIAQAEYTRALTDTQFHLDLVSQGNLDATVNVDKFLQSLVRGRAEAERTTVLLKNVAGVMGVELPAGIQVTNDELNALITEFYNTGSTAVTMNDIMNKAFAAARAGFTELVSAAVEGGKNWKDAWKDMDKSFIPKGEGGEVKDFINDMADLEITTQDAATQMGIFQMMLAAGLISEKEMSKWTNEAAEGLRKIRREAEDVVGADIASNLVDPFIALKRDGLSESDVAIITAFESKFAELAKGGITPEELKIMQDYAASLLEAAQNAERLEKNKLRPVLDTGSDYDEDVRLNGPGENEKAVNDIEEAKKKIETAAQAAQTAFANLATEGSNSISILVSNLKPHVTTIQTYFGTTIPNAIRVAALALLGFKNLMSGGGGGDGKGGFQNVSDVQGSGGGWGISPLTQKGQMLKIGLGGDDKKGGGSAGIPMFDVIAKQIVQIVTDIGLWIKANNVLDQTIAQIITDTGLWLKQNNLLDRTVAQLITDVGLFTKANNLIDRTIAQIITDSNLWVKGNNILARTLDQVKKNGDALIKTNNTLARTIVQVGKDFNSAADDADDFTKALKGVEKQARATAQAIKSIPSGGTRSAQHGMNETLEQDTIIVAHKGESVRIGTPASTTFPSRKEFMPAFEVPKISRQVRREIHNAGVDLSGVISALRSINIPQVLYAYITIDMGELGRVTKLSKIQLGMWNQG